MKEPAQRKWRVVKSEYLSQKPWFTVRHESVELPNGFLVPNYYIFEYPRWVNVIAITDDNKFVFISQYRHGLGRTSYEIPAGTVESSDISTLEAAQRELLEETGYSGGEWSEHMVICANPATQNNLTHCYIAKNVSKTATQNLDASEDIEVHLLTICDVYELLSADAIPQALMSAPLWKYIAELNTKAAPIHNSETVVESDR